MVDMSQFGFVKRNILSRQQWKIMDNAKKKGREMTARQAIAIARNQQRSLGNVVEDNLYLTKQGKEYSNLSSEDRAILRRSRETGKPPSHYEYSNGRVLLRPEYRQRALKKKRKR